MKKVKVKLFGHFRKYHPTPEAASSSFECGLPEGDEKVSDLIHKLNIPEEEVKIVFINNLKAALDQKLDDGDEIGIFPPIAGG